MAESLVPSRAQYLRQLGSFYVTDLLAVGVFLVLTPLLLHHLGNARFGVLAIADSVLGYIGLLNLGLNPALTRFLAGSEATGNRERTVSLLSTSAMLFGVLGVAGGIVASLVAAHIGTLFNVDAAVVDDCARFISIKGLEFIIAMPLGIYAAGNYSIGSMVKMNGVRAVGGGLETLLAFVVVWTGSGLAMLAVNILCITLATGLLQRWSLRRAVPNLNLRFDAIKPGLVRELFSYGLLFALDNLIVLLVFKTDDLVIGAVSSAAALASYAVAGQVSRALTNTVGRIPGTLFPAFSALAAKNDRDTLRRVFCRTIDACFATSAAIAVALAAFGGDLIRGWLGIQPEALPDVVIYCFAAFAMCHAPVSAGSKYLAAAGLMKRVAFMTIIEGFGNLGLTLILVRVVGLPGVILATVIVQISTTSWYNASQAARDMALPLPAFWRDRVLRFAGPMLASGALAVLWRVLIPHPSAPVAIAAILSCFAVHGLLAWQVLRGAYAEPAVL